MPLARAALGISGDVAVAVPTAQPGPEPVRHGTSADRLTPRPLGSLSAIVLLAASFAACVMANTSVAPLSLASFVSEALRTGA